MASLPRDNASLLSVFQSRKMAFILLLGFSSGLPLYLTSRTLQAWLTIEGVDLTTIGMFSLVALPYSLKFVWSPLLDRFSLPRLGRRRGWMAFSQILLLVSIAAMSLGDPADAVTGVALVAIAIAFFSATQDIAIDAYRTDVLEVREMGAGAAVNVLGYRVAMLLTGAGALILADRMSWPTVYLIMAAFMLIGLVASFRTPEPADPVQPPSSLKAAILDPFVEFAGRFGLRRALLILTFIVVYRMGDALVNNMTTPFLLQTGFSQTDVGTVQGGMGLLATILGIVVGGGAPQPDGDLPFPVGFRTVPGRKQSRLPRTGAGGTELPADGRYHQLRILLGRAGHRGVRRLSDEPVQPPLHRDAICSAVIVDGGLSRRPGRTLGKAR